VYTVYAYPASTFYGQLIINCIVTLNIVPVYYSLSQSRPFPLKAFAIVIIA